MTDRIVDYLTHGYWQDYRGEAPRKHHDDGFIRVGRDDWTPMGNDGIVWVSLGNLTGHFRDQVQKSFERIDNMIPLDFEYVTGPAQINVSIRESDSWTQGANYTVQGRSGEFDNIVSANIKFTTKMETTSQENAERVAMHEILHTLGLGHPGPYNNGKFTPIFEEDSQNISIMSYLRGTDRPWDIRQADVEALQVLYGTTRVDDLIELYITRFDELPTNAWLEEATAAYHTGTSVQQMFNELYEGLPTASPEQMVMDAFNDAFNRDAKAGGITYWSNEIEGKGLSQGDFMYMLLQGAGERDQSYLDGMNDLGAHFALEIESNNTELADQALAIYDAQGYDTAFDFLVGIPENEFY